MKNNKTINIIIPCGLLDLKDPVEINRFVRLKIQLESISLMKEKTDNIQFTFVELGDKPRLDKTIQQMVPEAKYLFYDQQLFGFNQIILWNKAIETYPNFDFYLFSHSDIIFPNNLYNVLNRRINDNKKNYYVFRFNFNFKTIYNNYTNQKLVQTLESLPKIISEETYHDYGYKYILDKFKQNYNPKIKYLKYRSLPNNIQIYQQPKWVGESFMCISKENFNKLNLKPVLGYNNDVAIRDLSVINGIESEWLNDEIILLHMLGTDDNKNFFYKKDKKNFEVLVDILSQYPELAHWGLFRFQKENIPYIKNLDYKKIYNEYIKDKMSLYNKEDFWHLLYKETIKNE